jgi:hypothetical protein
VGDEGVLGAGDSECKENFERADLRGWSWETSFCAVSGCEKKIERGDLSGWSEETSFSGISVVVGLSPGSSEVSRR